MKNRYLKSFILFAFFIGLLSFCTNEVNTNEIDSLEAFKTTSFLTKDSLEITADIYEVKDTKKPIILLFHQAMFSRGEYREIAPKLVTKGYTCIAIDQRSGMKVNGVKNETHARAKKKGLKTKYPYAYPDLLATIAYTKEHYPGREIIIWGSSYSSSLVLIIASQNPEIKGVLSFSPGEYFEFNQKQIIDYANDISCPVFITSAKNEKKEWIDIFNAIKSEDKSYFLPTLSGFHGSKALWEEKDGHEEYWNAVYQFLDGLK